jgi:hypothetical protein
MPYIIIMKLVRLASIKYIFWSSTYTNIYVGYTRNCVADLSLSQSHKVLQLIFYAGAGATSKCTVYHFDLFIFSYWSRSCIKRMRLCKTTQNRKASISFFNPLLGGSLERCGGMACGEIPPIELGRRWKKGCGRISPLAAVFTGSLL